MTREELKAHCKKQIEMCEMWAKAKGENPCGKVYEEHKLILELLEQPQKTWGLDDAREDFMNDVYNTLDFLPTNNEANRIIDSFDRVTSGLEQQPCEDAVSRQDALNCVTFNEFRYRIVEDIKALPSVTPKEKSEYEHDHDVVKAYNNGQAYILDKVRADIEQEITYKPMEMCDYRMGLTRALNIIDKYRGE